MITVSSEILDIFSKDFSGILNELREQWRRTTHQDVNIFSKVHTYWSVGSAGMDML